jgi:hypothetical protein
MCLRRAPEKYIAGAALDRAAIEPFHSRQDEITAVRHWTRIQDTQGSRRAGYSNVFVASLKSFNLIEGGSGVLQGVILLFSWTG